MPRPRPVPRRRPDTAPATPPAAGCSGRPEARRHANADPAGKGLRRSPGEDPAQAAPAPAQSATSRQGDRIKASPLARRLAQAQDIDLGSLKGSGPDGRIVRADVDAAVGKAPTAPTRRSSCRRTRPRLHPCRARADIPHEA